jgi:hypothetical protein
MLLNKTPTSPSSCSNAEATYTRPLAGCRPFSSLVLELVASLAESENHQDLPKVVAVEQAGEVVLLGTAAEAGESVQGDIFRTGRCCRRRAREPATGLLYQASEIAFPERLDGLAVALLELLKTRVTECVLAMGRSSTEAPISDR